MIAGQAAIEVRTADSFNEIDDCVHLQQSVWQFPDIDVIPRRMMVVARSVGGQIFGAWDGARLAGFALSIPGVRNGSPYLHSHMLAVSPEYRNRGIGMKLKLAQRREALERGIEVIEWTFDPLQTRNAYFNIEKLGAVVRRYSPDFYGPSNSPLHGSLPTDRLHAEWRLKSKRVESLLAGESLPQYGIKETVSVTDREFGAGLATGESAGAGLELLLRVRRQLQEAFARGMAVLRFEAARNAESKYLLGTADDAA